jgi:uncharacterized protein (TIGR02271 family)
MTDDTLNNPTIATRTITAFFENRQDADEAVQRLVSEGFSRNGIRVVPGAQSSGASATTGNSEGSGFWETLKDFFLPNEDRHLYAEGLRRGGHLVSMTTSDANYERALDILDDEGTIDLGERESEWRNAGWTGYTGADYPAKMTSQTETPRPDQPRDNEEVIPVVEEELRVGKREVNNGRVRVRSYVVETPVSEQVTLREEHVNVERRPVDRSTTGEDKLFQERSVELEQTSEEVVVSKDARVKEEVVVKKDVGQRTETVSDNVRRTEVDVEDDREDQGLSGTGGTARDVRPPR